MCLIKQHPVHLHGRYIGYKVIRLVDGKYVPCQMYSPELVLNQWITDDSEYIVPAMDGSKYKTGFHVFARRSDAERYALSRDCIATVELDRRHITARGSQAVYRLNGKRSADAQTIVCRRIRIIKISKVA